MDSASGKKCEICEINTGSRYCLECKQYFCTNCENLHTKMTISKHHEFQSASDMIPERRFECTDHNEDFSFQCTSCNVSICNTCVTETHNGHHLAKIVDTINTLKKKIEDNLSVKQWDAGKYMKKAETIVGSLDNHADQIVELLQKEGEKFKAMVDANVIKMIESVKDQSNKEKDKWTKRIKENKEHLDALVVLDEKSKDLNKTRNDGKLIKALQGLRKEIARLKIEHVHEIPYMSYKTDESATEDVIKQLFGVFKICDYIPDMTPDVGIEKPFRCSTCGWEQTSTARSGPSGNCLKTLGSNFDPTALAPYDAVLAGQVYDADAQCVQINGIGSYMCRGQYGGNYESICNVLWCSNPAATSCYKSIAGEGTRCGNKKWCVSGVCTSDIKAPAGNENCLYGDRKGKIFFNGWSCAEMYRKDPRNCVLVPVQCCASCYPETPTVAVTTESHKSTSTLSTTIEYFTTIDTVTTTIGLTTTEPVTAKELLTTTESVTTTEPLTAIESVTTKELEKTTEPVPTTEQVTTTESVTTTEPVTTTESVTTTEHATTTKFVTTTVPLTTTKSATTLAPVITTNSVTITKPMTTTEAVITTTQAVTTTEPVTTTESVTTAKPVTTTESVTPSEPLTTTEAVTTTEPVTTTESVTTAKLEATTELVTPTEHLTTTESVSTIEPFTTLESVSTTEPSTSKEAGTLTDSQSNLKSTTTTQPQPTSKLITTTEPPASSKLATAQDHITTTGSASTAKTNPNTELFTTTRFMTTESETTHKQEESLKTSELITTKKQQATTDSDTSIERLTTDSDTITKLQTTTLGPLAPSSSGFVDKSLPLLIGISAISGVTILGMGICIITCYMRSKKSSKNYRYKGNKNYGIALDSFHESQSCNESERKSSYSQHIDPRVISYGRSNNTQSALYSGNNEREIMSGLGGHHNEGYHA